MLKVEEKVIYKAFGLLVTSEIPLPELSQMGNQMGNQMDSIDIEIKIEDLSKLWFEFSDKQNGLVINENLVMFQLSNIATFAIQDGKRIRVSPLQEYEADIVRIWILGTCMGAILMQRKIFPLHGSAIAINGKAYAIVGDSGAGKSTLASAFLHQGYQLLSDDVIPVSLSQDKQTAYVTPSYPQQKLWQDSLNNFGMEASDYRSVFGRVTKFNVPITSNYCSDPLPLAGVFELVKTDIKLDIYRIEKLDRLRTIFCHTYRQFLIPRMGLMEWHFLTSVAIVKQINMFQLCRPASGFTAPQLVSLLLDTLQDCAYDESFAKAKPKEE